MFATAEGSFMTRVAIGLEAEGSHIKYLLYEKGPFFVCVCVFPFYTFPTNAENFMFQQYF